jgi:hypothetical protein
MVLRLFHDQHSAFFCCISNVLANYAGRAGLNPAIAPLAADLATSYILVIRSLGDIRPSHVSRGKPDVVSALKAVS